MLIRKLGFSPQPFDVGSGCRWRPFFLSSRMELISKARGCVLLGCVRIYEGMLVE